MTAPRPGPADVVVLDEIDSTNAEVMRRLAAGTPPPFWVRALVQTAGRGRSGRSWTSPTGNLYATLATRLDCELQFAHQLSFVAGIAVIDAVRAVAGQSPVDTLRLKWPNDVLLGTAKLSGMLIETTRPVPAGPLVAAIGIGINVSTAPQGLARDVATLADAGITTTAAKCFDALAIAMEHWLAVWNDGRNFDRVRSAWLARSGATGEPISIHTNEPSGSGASDGRTAGTFAGLDEDGALLMRLADGRVVRFTFGDVTIAR